MKRLVIDARMINSSGIGTYLKNILPRVIDKYKNTILLGNRQELSYFEWTRGIKIIPFNAKIYSIKEQLLFPIKIPKCDLLWCPHFNAPFFPTRATKIITTIHDVNHLANPNSFSKITNIIAFLFYKNAKRVSEHIITVSAFSKNEIIKYLGIPSKKITVIYNAIDRTNFTNNLKRGIVLPDKYILYVGNVKPHKNLITLLKAYHRMSEGLKSKYKLVVLGKKDGFITSESSLFQFVQDNKIEEYIQFTGYLTDEAIPSIYRQASLFVFPSLYEGFGLPILEAMASGVPVLCANVASLPEVGGEACMYFNPIDYEELESKMVILLLNKEKANQTIQNGFAQVEKFSLETTISEHLDVMTKEM